MPGTALKHFAEDIDRAQAIVVHAESLSGLSESSALLRADLLRSAWMFAIGAVDAYFCDAYTDIVAATIISKSRHQPARLPDFFYDIRFPIRAILEPYAAKDNWRWRMAARKMMERESVLSLSTIQQHFNKFFRDGHKFFRDCTGTWLQHAEANKRVFGITAYAYGALAPDKQREAALIRAHDLMKDRYREIFQRRHDCIHNCDRPRIRPQPLDRARTVLKVIQDAQFLVCRCDEHINTEFRQFLLRIGCPKAIVAQAGY